MACSVMSHEQRIIRLDECGTCAGLVASGVVVGDLRDFEEPGSQTEQVPE
jgi:hypothetical protein